MTKILILIDSDFIASDLDTSNLKNGQFSWKTPSNIALVKYWGKQEPQLPANPSISFTLKSCHTLTTLKFERLLEVTQKESIIAEFDKQNLEVFFEGLKNEAFKPKIHQFFNRILAYVPFVKDYKFEIHSENSFPHSSGIASSASGMGALALNIMSLERTLNPNISTEYFVKKASFLARLGSGSACRSIEGPLIVWGEHNDYPKSSDLYGIRFPFKTHEIFENFQDTILLVDQGEKEVSSTVGHQLMHGHPFAVTRFKQARNNMSLISKVLQLGNLDQFIEIVESEALSLHAMMQTSNPSYILMKPNTLHILEEIRKFRKESGANLCFTLDAGANVHLLYPENEKEFINNFIVNKLAQYCQENRYICDELGTGAIQISS